VLSRDALIMSIHMVWGVLFAPGWWWCFPCMPVGKVLSFLIIHIPIDGSVFCTSTLNGDTHNIPDEHFFVLC